MATYLCAGGLLITDWDSESGRSLCDASDGGLGKINYQIRSEADSRFGA